MLYDVAGVIHHTKDHKFSVREQRIYDFFNSNKVGVLSTVGKDGQPGGSVIYYTIGRDFTASFLTKASTRKFANIVHDPRVMLTVFDAKYQTVGTIIGKATKVTDSQLINQVAKSVIRTSLSTSEGGIMPLAKLEQTPYVVLSISPDQVRLASYASPGSDGHSEILESSESFDLNPAGA
jgi:general stress protein 26